MYPGPWRTLPEVRLLDWPDYQGERSLEAVSARLIAMHEIADGAVVVGSSLGGMVACEIARQRQLQRLILIGSAMSKEEVNGLLRTLVPLIDLAPLAFIQHAAGKIPAELTQMFSQAQAPFIRAMCRAIAEWRGADVGSTPVHRIHGRHDRVILLPARVDLVLDGGHLIAMTHAQECCEFVRMRVG
jgi:pimeloyl-ACP methyl ester carboxylesterase